jgi:hypothetical protein
MASMVQQPAKIFLADKRTCYESNEYRCLSTPIHQNGANHQIVRFSDETLAPGKSRFFTMDENISLILIPLVGTVVYGSLESQYSVKISPEELQTFYLTKGSYFSIKNPSEDELVNYLQIWIKVDVTRKKIKFDDYKENTLNTILDNPYFKIHFGVLDGRTEATFSPNNTKNTVISFVINGAFEIQNRLLESRDSLVLWDIAELELESLSENAIILILEKYSSY